MGILGRLRQHPLGVRAHFEQSVVLTYAFPAAQLGELIPAPFALDVSREHPYLGYAAVALVRARELRPTGLPRALGRDFFLAGYRVFVRYTDLRGRRLRGLYILGSATDSGLMARLGGLTTDYRYEVIDVAEDLRDSSYAVESVAGGLDICVDWSGDPVLPDGSPFADWRAARRFAGPLPFTFSYDEAEARVLLVEGVREGWRPQPVRVWRADVTRLRVPPLRDGQLASAFRVHDVPYRWRRGYCEPWPR